MTITETQESPEVEEMVDGIFEIASQAAICSTAMIFADSKPLKPTRHPDDTYDRGRWHMWHDLVEEYARIFKMVYKHKFDREDFFKKCNYIESEAPS